MFGRLGGSTGRAHLCEASADGARGAQCWKSSRGAKRNRRPTHISRFTALRDSYTIARGGGAAGGRDAPPRGKTHAGRASSGRSEAASASSDPYSKMEFYP